MRQWPIAVFFSCAAAVVVFAGWTSSEAPDLFTITNGEQYVQLLQKTQREIQGPVFAFDSGNDLSQAQRSRLAANELDLQRLIAFQPDDFGLYLLLAKTQRAQGKDDKARENYRQSLVLAPQSQDAGVNAMLAEANYDLSSDAFLRRDFREAERLGDAAVSASPNVAKYLAGAAQVKFALEDYKAARVLVDRALAAPTQDDLANELDAKLRKLGH